MKRILFAIAILLAFAIQATPQAQHGTALTWVASSSAASCVSPCTLTYNVYRGTTSNGESIVPQNSSPITGLTFFDSVTLNSNSQTFFYYVEAVETSGGITSNSIPSNEVSVTFPALPQPPLSLSGKPQ